MVRTTPYFNSPDTESLQTHARGPSGSLTLSDEILCECSSGDLFGLTQSVGMGFDPRRVLGDQYLILSTQGGVLAPDGKPIALGYHTGHWEVGQVKDIANMVTYLASDATSFVSGQTVYVDGGLWTKTQWPYEQE